MKNPTTVMLVEDNPEYREVIRLALSRDPEFELVGEFGTAEIALRDLRESGVRSSLGVVLLDLQLPGMSGLDALPEFARSLPGARFIMLTQSDREADVLQAISLGADGYLLKSSTISQIKEGIRTVVGGGASLDPGVSRFVLRALQSGPQAAAPEVTLSAREMEILNLLAEGLLKKEISDRLGIAYPTVDSHVRHIYDKLKVHNAPAAITAAYRMGIFKPNR